MATCMNDVRTARRSFQQRALHHHETDYSKPGKSGLHTHQVPLHQVRPGGRLTIRRPIRLRWPTGSITDMQFCTPTAILALHAAEASNRCRRQGRVGMHPRG